MSCLLKIYLRRILVVQRSGDDGNESLLRRFTLTSDTREVLLECDHLDQDLASVSHQSSEST